MDLGLHDPGQFVQMLECRTGLRAVIGIGIARDQFADAGHHGSQFGKVLDSLMSAFGQIDSLLAVEQPLNKAIQLLETDESILAQIYGGRL